MKDSQMLEDSLAVRQSTVNAPQVGSTPTPPANTKAIGEISEAMVLARFLQLGWVVLQPFGDNQRYDYVIDRGVGFERIQVKTGRIRKGSVVFSPTSSYAHRGRKAKGYKGQIEMFAVYCPDNDKVYLAPVGEFNTAGCLRLYATKNNQNKGIKWANNFET